MTAEWWRYDHWSYCHSQGPHEEYPAMKQPDSSSAPNAIQSMTRLQKLTHDTPSVLPSLLPALVFQLNFTYHKKMLEELHHERSTFAFPSCDTHQRTQVSQKSCRKEAKQELSISRGSSSKPATIGQKYCPISSFQSQCHELRRPAEQQLLCWLCTRKNTREPFFRQELITKFHFNR